MRVLRLEIEGFGPFRTRQVVDLTSFEAEGLFVIAGRTGAGKSTILDAITFALYGSVPRYDGTKATLRSDFCTPDEPTSVVLELEVAGERYRIERSPEYERAKRVGEGTTTSAQSARLDRWQHGRWETLSVKPREVGKELSDILRLTASQFLQVILLAQGRFSDFLQADTRARREVLRSLFDTRRYEQLEKQLGQWAREADQQVAEIEAELARQVERAASAAASVAAAAAPAEGATARAGLVGEDATAQAGLVGDDTDRAGWFAAVQDRVQAEHAAALARSEGARARQEKAETALHQAQEAQQRFTRYRAAVAAVADLTAQEPQIQALSQALEAAAAADPVLELAAAHGAAHQQQLAAATQLAQATSDLHRRAASADPTDLIGAPDLADLADLTADLTDLTAEVTEEFPDDVTTGPDPTASGEGLAAVLPELRDLVSRCDTTAGALAAALALEKELPALHRKHSDASAELAELQEQREALQIARDQAPAELAALRAELSAVRTVAEQQPQLAAQAEAARARVTAHASLERLTADLAAAEAAAGDCAARVTQAAAHQHALIERQLRGAAGRLAAGLVAEEPCPVCGSPEHPAPAPPDPDAVDETQLENAGHAVEEAQSALREARVDIERLRTQAATVREIATGDSQQATEELTQAQEAVEGAARAARQAEELRQRVTATEERVLSATADIEKIGAAIEAATARVAALESQLALADREVTQARGQAATVAAQAAALRRLREALATVIAASEGYQDAAEVLTAATGRLAATLADSPFDGLQQAQQAGLTGTQRTELTARVRRHHDDITGARAVLADLPPVDLDQAPIDLEPLVSAASDAAAGLEAERRREYLIATRAEEVALARGEFDTLQHSSAQLRERQQLLAALAATLEGKEPNSRRIRLETFVLAARLETIVVAANRRLVTMSSGRYELQADDSRQHHNVETGLALRVFDAHTGRTRSTRSLSGGETFLASLALALGLAETVSAEAGGIRLDTLFIDEGFGSLDAETLEIAMATLDDLRAGGRTIGLISHVEAMKEQIPAKLEVVPCPDGSSRILGRAPVPTPTLGR